MKNLFILTALTIAAISCKKSHPVDKPVTPPEGQKWIVTTIAGDGSPSLANGAALSARFHFPNDLAVTSDGTVYVTDIQNHSIRRIAAGQVATLAGSDLGIVNGNGASAQFRHPFSIALDANANIFTTDVDDPRIRKTTPGGDVSTYAGSAVSGMRDGEADSARFGEETTICTDAQGNIYAADAQNNRIRKISVSGQVTTIAGTGEAGFRNGSATTAQFNFPSGIAIDRQGNLYVADGLNYCIRKITPAGDVSTYAGTNTAGYTDGDAATARFTYAVDVVIDGDGNLYVLDLSRVRKISAEGVVSTIAGSTDGFADGDGATAKFTTPDGIAIDAQGNLYIADTDNNRIRKVSRQ
jgi:sugar lactone lactonase YvrE